MRFFIKNIYHSLTSIKNYLIDEKKSSGYPVKVFNFWKHNIDNNWFLRFIHSRKILDKYPDIKISLFSVFGNRFIIDLPNSDIKIFFTGENIDLQHNLRYRDHALNKNIDLAMGFDYLNNNRYLRFPLWVIYYFPPEFTEKDIILRCNELSFHKLTERTKFASHVSRYDHLGIRREMCESLSAIEKVDCDGLFMNNNDDLKTKYGDKKHLYLKNYKFNLCPENSNSDGYVTEKIFEAIAAGCIPVYWGSNNNPEPEILNHNAIFFWNKNTDSNNDLIIKEIKHLNENPKLLKEFMMQPRLKPDAAEIVTNLLNNLELRLKKILSEG